MFHGKPKETIPSANILYKLLFFRESGTCHAHLFYHQNKKKCEGFKLRSSSLHSISPGLCYFIPITPKEIPFALSFQTPEDK
jgi:hypothetical protein